MIFFFLMTDAAGRSIPAFLLQILMHFETKVLKIITLNVSELINKKVFFLHIIKHTILSWYFRWVLPWFLKYYSIRNELSLIHYSHNLVSFTHIESFFPVFQDPYLDRTLPHLIGTPNFMQDDNVGLKDISGWFLHFF